MASADTDYRGPQEVTLADMRVKQFGITLNRPDMWVCIWRPHRTPHCRTWKMCQSDLNRLNRFTMRRYRVRKSLSEAGRPLFPDIRFPLLGN